MELRECTPAQGGNRHALPRGRSGTGPRLSRASAALVLATALGVAGPARAENECGLPAAGEEIVCSPSTYDPSEGNILYGHDETGEDETTGDFALRLTGDLSINYDSARPGDDAHVVPVDPESRRNYGAVWITPGRFGEYAGDVSLHSSADVTANARGVFAGHYGKSGALRMEVSGGDIATTGVEAHAIRGFRYLGSAGELVVVVRGATIDTEGDYAYGVSSVSRGDGDIHLDVRESSLTIAGRATAGILGIHEGEGDLNVRAQDLDISAAGEDADGVYAQHDGTGDANLDVRNGSITTTGEGAEGVFAQHVGAGDLILDVRGVSVTTTGAGSSGIYGNHLQMHGNVVVRVRGGDVSTAGEGNAFGVRGFHSGAGAVDMDLQETTIATTGAGAHGAAIYRFGSGSARIAVDGGSVHAAGAKASGIQIGRLREDGSVEFASPVGEDGYRRQSVSVNAPVTGGSGENAAGVHLAGGGRVAIGPRGRVGAASGVAILASGGAPKLGVEMDLDGRRAGDVVDGVIRNDGGETTLVVNGVTLHEGATGATGAEAANGARDVSVRASETVAGRTFTPVDFIERHAPRAAVYEALPGFLLRLGDGRPAGRRVTRPDSPAWVRISGARGSFEPRRASVGAEYDFRRGSAEAGLDVALGENVTGTLSLRHVSGAAEVASSYGGGDIEAEGLGVAAHLTWRGSDGYYGRGRLAFTSYDVDLSSRERGSLAREVEANGRHLAIEAGRRIAFGETATLTPRAWAARRSLSGGAFTDAVGSRVSVARKTRSTGGIGLSAETARALEDGELTLRASVGVERALGGADTATGVSGERLVSETSDTRILLGLGGTWRKERFSLGAQVTAGGPDSDDAEYSARISLDWKF